MLNVHLCKDINFKLILIPQKTSILKQIFPSSTIISCSSSDTLKIVSKRMCWCIGYRMNIFITKYKFTTPCFSLTSSHCNTWECSFILRLHKYEEYFAFKKFLFACCVSKNLTFQSLNVSSRNCIIYNIYASLVRRNG